MRSGRASSPGLAEKSISTRSAPASGGGAAVGSSPNWRGSTSTVSRAPSRPRGLSRPWIARPKSLATLRRAVVSAAAACFSADQASARGASRASRSASSFSRAASWASVASRRSTSSSGVQWNRAASRRYRASRASTSSSRAGSSSQFWPRSRRPKATSRASSARRSSVAAASASSGTARARGSSVRATRFKQPLRRAVGLVEQGIALGRGRAELVGVREPLRLEGQLVVLAPLGIGGGQLVALELQQRPLATARLGRIDQLLALPPQGLVLPTRRAVGVHPVAQAPVVVEQLALAVGVHQGAALVLAVDVDQSLAQLLEGGQGDRQAVDRRAAAPLRRDPTGDDQRVVLQHVAAAQDRLDLGAQPGLRDLEDRRRPRLGLPRPDQLGRGLAAQDQVQRRQ